MTEKEPIEQVQAVNHLLRDFSKSQSGTIKQLKNTLIIVSICFTVIIVSMIIGFFWYESQYETVECTSTTLETDGDYSGINSVTNGDMYNDSATHNERGLVDGKSKSDNRNN